ncbi:MAG: hypothetical protein AUI14_09725 [Actinobacteria bacterium 13_2_20CM_2_71_6]|nr:MAG: hypothetical protein AUI14_09725 [Actinobacteria bacterium 13_2_20CM_2_71_6]
MKTWVRKSLKVGVLSAGFLLIGGAAAAQAADSHDNFGVLAGNQPHAGVAAPASVSGNSLALLGSSPAPSHSGGSAAGSAGGSASSSNNFGVGSGNQAGLSAIAPVSISGNAIGGLGSASAHSTGSGSSAMLTPHSATTSQNFGILGGNQVHAPVSVPISITGNSLGLLGSATAHGTGGASTGTVSPATATTGDNSGIGSGNQVAPAIDVPIDICGNSLGLLGTAEAGCGDNGSGSGSGGYPGGGNGSGNGGGYTGGGSGSGSGNGGGYTGGGSGGYVPLTGTSTGTGAGTGAASDTATGLASGTATGLASDTAASAVGDTAAPVTSLVSTKHHAKAHHHKAVGAKAAGNEAATTRTAHGTTAAGATTSRNFGILGGNQIAAMLSIPASVTHNALGVLGTARA